MSKPVEGEIVAPPHAGGRPTIKTPDIVTKLEAAFHNGFNITEACGYADIERQTYYRWLAEDDKFSYRMSRAQAAPNTQAKSIIIQALKDGDVPSARWWLERKDPEFKNKTVVEPGLELAETRAKIKEFLDDTDDAGDSQPDAPSSEPTAPAALAAGDEVAETPTDIS